MADENQAYIPEHSGVGAPKTGNPQDDQTEDERKAVALAEKIYAKCKRARAQKDKDFVTDFRYFRGDQWKQKRPSYRHSEVINIVTSGIRNIVPILTDPVPQVTTTPEDPSDFEFSEIITQVISGKWARDNTSQILTECVIDACVTGTAIAYVPWCDEMCDGIGDYVVESVDIAHVFPDPSARDVNDRRAKVFVIAEPVDVQELREEYPDKKDKIKPDLSDAVTYNSYADETQEFAFKSPVDNRMMVPDSRGQLGQGNPDLALKLTVYIKSDDVVSKKETVTDSQTGTAVEIEQQVKKYPNGRKIVTVGRVLLEDVELEYEDGNFPYARLVNDAVPRDFFGDGEIKFQKSPQDIVNKMVSYFMDYLIIMGNPHWVVDSEAQVDVDNITNEPGMVIVKRGNGQATQVQGMSPPPFLMNSIQYFVSDIFSKISGNNEISQGAISKANLSGDAISQLTEASQTRLRAKARNIDAFLQQLGQLILSRILQFYNLPRIVRITGKDSGEVAQYFKFSVEDQVDPEGNKYKMATYSEHVGNGLFSEPKQVPLKSNLDVRIATGSALPFMKAQRDQQAERFFDKGILDAEDLLNTVEYPKKEQIIAKWKQRQQAAADAQAQQAAMKGGGPPPPPPPQ